MIHKALRLIRQYHGRSPSDLAQELNISKNKLIAIESSKSPVNGDILKRYSEAFDIPVSSLIFFSESIGTEGRYAKKMRTTLAGKVLEVLQWINDRNETKDFQA